MKAVVDALDRLAYALHKDLWDKASVIGVCFTLVAVCYYTYETLRLRRAAQRQNEISIEPALAVYIREFAHGNPRQVVIENVGRGPAFNIEIRQPSSFWTITLRNNVIAPGRCEGLGVRPRIQTSGVVLPGGVKQSEPIMFHGQKLPAILPG